ncbi:MAG: DUF2330 domain-containing protein [Myxococcales bacterium]|nr:DUF2330 domain-containing protein [Myxococcales bacterium]
MSAPKPTPRRRTAVTLALCALALARPAPAAVIAPTPGQTVELLDEHVLLVYDPLTASQTTVVQHTFAGTASPFGIILPVPDQARVRTHPQRLRNAIRNRLHPQGRVQRTLSVELTSWAAGCALRDVGDGVPIAGDDEADNRRGASVEATTLGAAPEPLHDWLLENGFTVAPAQAAWLNELRASGWGLVGVTIRPSAAEGTPEPRMQGPVLSITHEAREPLYAARHPSFALVDDGRPGPPLELAVLTEWAVAVDVERPPRPFFADVLTEKAVNRLGADAGGLPWDFRREGSLTAFRVERPTDGMGIVRFVRSDPWPTIRPTPEARIRANTLRLPIELVLILAALAVWGWRRPGRRRLGRGGQRLQ